MKKLRLLYFLTLIAAFGLTACGDDDDNDNNPSVNGTMTAEVDGVAWEANTLAQIIAAGPSLGITASTDNSPDGVSSTIQLNLMNVNATGTYTLDGTNLAALSTASYAFLPDANASSPNDATTFNSLGESGTVTITTFTNDKLEGTFEFVGAEVQGSGSRTITNGAFSISR